MYVLYTFRECIDYNFNCKGAVARLSAIYYLYAIIQDGKAESGPHCGGPEFRPRSNLVLTDANIAII